MKPKELLGCQIETRVKPGVGGILTGTVIKAGRRNVTVEVHVRFRPDGPWFRQEHKVDVDDVAAYQCPGGEIVKL